MTPQQRTDPLPYVPRDDLAAALRWWWLIALFMIAGGCLGWLIHLTQPPVYETRAVLSTTINFARTGELTDTEEDNAIGIVGDVITSTDVLEKTVTAAEAIGLHITQPELKNMLYAERTDTDWYFRVRHTDPQVAASVANLWSEQAYNTLIAALQHAIQAEALQRRADRLADCVEQVSLAPVTAVCQDLDFTAVQQNLSDTSKQAVAELEASLGVSPAMTFLLSQRADIPSEPSRNGQNTLVLAGALAGMIVGLVVVLSHLPDRLSRSRRVR
jgi:uncharacterized protein involved in exopolysaccharide biosynthesis